MNRVQLEAQRSCRGRERAIRQALSLRVRIREIHTFVLESILTLHNRVSNRSLDKLFPKHVQWCFDGIWGGHNLQDTDVLRQVQTF